MVYVVAAFVCTCTQYRRNRLVLHGVRMAYDLHVFLLLPWRLHHRARYETSVSKAKRLQGIRNIAPIKSVRCWKPTSWYGHSSR